MKGYVITRKLAYLQHLQNYKQLYINELLNSLRPQVTTSASHSYSAVNRQFGITQNLRISNLTTQLVSTQYKLHNKQIYYWGKIFTQKHANNSRQTTRQSLCVTPPTRERTSWRTLALVTAQLRSWLPDGSNQVVGTATQHPQVHLPVCAPNSASYRLNWLRSDTPAV